MVDYAAFPLTIEAQNAIKMKSPLGGIRGGGTNCESGDFGGWDR
jgi:hypothetical protein